MMTMEETASIPATRYDVDVKVNDVMSWTEAYWQEMIDSGFFDRIGPKVGEAIVKKKAERFGGGIGRLGGALGKVVGVGTIRVLPEPEVTRQGTAFVSEVTVVIAGRDSFRLRSVSRAAGRGSGTQITVQSELIGRGAKIVASKLAGEIRTIQEVMQNEMATGLENFVGDRVRRGIQPPGDNGLVA